MIQKSLFLVGENRICHQKISLEEGRNGHGQGQVLFVHVPSGASGVEISGGKGDGKDCPAAFENLGKEMRAFPSHPP